jgi:hypothetical protein
MANEQAPAVVSTIDVKSVLAELAVHFLPIKSSGGSRIQLRTRNAARSSPTLILALTRID